MTEQEQRIAIAEACGWKVSRDGDNQMGWHIPPAPRENFPTVVLPDYLHDLNAMHEAEKILTQQQKTQYIFQLQTICGGQQFGDNYFATAAQRVEAFLRTIGKWKE